MRGLFFISVESTFGQFDFGDDPRRDFVVDPDWCLSTAAGVLGNERLPHILEVDAHEGESTIVWQSQLNLRDRRFGPSLLGEWICANTFWPTHGRVKIIFFVRLHNVEWCKGFLFALSNQPNQSRIGSTWSGVTPRGTERTQRLKKPGQRGTNWVYSYFIKSLRDILVYLLFEWELATMLPIYKPPIDRNEWKHSNDIPLIHQLVQVQVNGRREYPSSLAVCRRKLVDTLQSHPIHRTIHKTR